MVWNVTPIFLHYSHLSDLWVNFLKKIHIKNIWADFLKNIRNWPLGFFSHPKRAKPPKRGTDVARCYAPPWVVTLEPFCWSTWGEGRHRGDRLVQQLAMFFGTQSQIFPWFFMNFPWIFHGVFMIFPNFGVLNLWNPDLCRFDPNVCCFQTTFCWLRNHVFMYDDLPIENGDFP